jgi:hypothetical protein
MAEPSLCRGISFDDEAAAQQTALTAHSSAWHSKIPKDNHEETPGFRDSAVSRLRDTVAAQTSDGCRSSRYRFAADSEAGSKKLTRARTATLSALPISPRQRLLVWFVCWLPGTLVMVFFSEIGMGLRTYNWIAKTSLAFPGTLSAQTGMLFGTNIVICTLYFLLDYPMWPGHRQAQAAILPWVVLLVSVVALGPQHPWAPIVFVLFHEALFVGVLRAAFCADVSRRQYFGTVVAACTVALVGVVSIYAIWWTVKGEHWTDAKSGLSKQVPFVWAALSKSYKGASDIDLNYTTCGFGNDNGSEHFLNISAIEKAAFWRVHIVALRLLRFGWWSSARGE